jgi:hypothetical protein
MTSGLSSNPQGGLYRELTINDSISALMQP